jgi:hypothetical protein
MRAIRRLASDSAVLGCFPSVLAFVTSCNALLGTPEEVLRDASVSDGAGDEAILADASGLADIYYTTGNDDGLDKTGSLWRLAK